MWNGVAEAWRRNADFVDAHLAAATQCLLDGAGVAPGAEVLEVAAGPGGAGLAAAARTGVAGRVLLSDDAPAMVEIAARRASALSWVGTAVFDQLALGVPDESFDSVIARHGLMFAAEPAAAVREATRVLRPGGRYATMTWGPREDNPWLGCVLDAVGEQFGAPFPPPGIAGPFSLDSAEALAEALRTGGLEGVVVEHVATPMPEASLADWWGRVPELAGPLAAALAGMEPEVREAIRARAIAKAEAAARRTDGGVELDGSVLVGSGRRPAASAPGSPGG